MPSNSNSGATATESDSNYIAIRDGNMLRMRAQLDIAAATDVVFTVRINGGPTALTVTILAGNLSGTVTSTVAFLEGNKITVSSDTVVASAGATAPRVVVEAEFT